MYLYFLQQKAVMDLFQKEVDYPPAYPVQARYRMKLLDWSLQRDWGYPLKGLSLEGGSFRGWSSMMSWTKEEALGLTSLSFMAITTPKSNPP